MRAPDDSPQRLPAALRRVALLREVGLLGATALIVVNMVGSSIYTLPAAIAADVGPLGIAAWALTAAGYLFVALVFARLGTRYPRTGGPYVYARSAFGDLTGFVVVWSYWLSATIGNAAIVQGAVGYLPDLVPALAGRPQVQLALSLALLWLFCLVNVLGVRSSARVQIAVLFLGLVPLLATSVLGLFLFDRANLEPFAPRGLEALPVGMALILWAYSGVESATVPAEEVRAPETTIRRSTLIGYGVGTAVYLLTAVALAGALPNDAIAGSARPIALLAERAGGAWLASIVAFTAVCACLGTLNGWILMAGRIPVSAAEDGLFFRSLARIHPRFHTPAFGLAVGTAIASAMILLQSGAGLVEAFSFLVRLSGVLCLVPYFLSAAADWKLSRKPAERAVAGVAMAFVILLLVGCGLRANLWSAAAIAVGLPLYLVFRRRAGALGSPSP